MPYVQMDYNISKYIMFIKYYVMYWQGINGMNRQDTLNDGRRLRLARQPATISNSSLQDVDDTEYTGVELASYMGQLNTSWLDRREMFA